MKCWDVAGKPSRLWEVDAIPALVEGSLYSVSRAEDLPHLVKLPDACWLAARRRSPQILWVLEQKASPAARVQAGMDRLKRSRNQAVRLVAFVQILTAKPREPSWVLPRAYRTWASRVRPDHTRVCVAGRGQKEVVPLALMQRREDRLPDGIVQDVVGAPMLEKIDFS
jgi:hypothetical protein